MSGEQVTASGAGQMPLTLTLKYQPQQRVDMSPVVCQLLQGKTQADIAAIELHSGKLKLRLDSLFDIAGTDTQAIIIKKSFGKLDYIGKDLNGGSITVEGDTGAYLGMSMKAGSIKVQGNTGLYTGCEMKNGYLEVTGNTGDLLGAALPGNKKGMKGGVILVKGNVGDRAGDQLRRGTILVEGNAGDYCGSRMTAGTIAIMGQTGRFVGYAMRRGTLLLWHRPLLSASFNDCGLHTLGFLPMLFTSFRQFGGKFSEAANGFNRVQRYVGDMSDIGRGELLVKVA
jgi:formylmethanofuran dehydrogenase subunit C